MTKTGSGVVPIGRITGGGDGGDGVGVGSGDGVGVGVGVGAGVGAAACVLLAAHNPNPTIPAIIQFCLFMISFSPSYLQGNDIH